MVYDLVIIGGGPGGMTAGIYSARQKLKTLVITRDFGGQVVEKAVDIENYPGFEKIPGYELISKMEEQMRKKGVEVMNDEVAEIKKDGANFIFLTGGGERVEGKAGIIASGSEPRHLNVPGEKEYLGKGLSYCATCDGPLFNGKDVAIVGGGYAGFETALFMTAYARKIYIVEFCAECGAGKDVKDKVGGIDKIEVITSAQVKEIKGDGFVNKLEYTDLKSGEDRSIDVQGVFVQIGWQPATSFLNGLVELNNRKEIIVDFENFETSVPGLFAAGDVNSGKVKQIVVACGQGARAAISAYEHIKKKDV
jgi:thioredoxin-disulfide reductase